MTNHRYVDILLVDDNPGDVKLFREALDETNFRPVVCRVRDGDEAMRLLRRDPPFKNAPRPRIIILDLNLPCKDGRTALKEIKSDPALALIPVIVLSGSDAPSDICTAYALHASCYIVKPRDLYSLNAMVKNLVDLWLRWVVLPPE